MLSWPFILDEKSCNGQGMAEQPDEQQSKEWTNLQFLHPLAVLQSVGIQSLICWQTH